MEGYGHSVFSSQRMNLISELDGLLRVDEQTTHSEVVHAIIAGSGSVIGLSGAAVVNV